MLARYSPSGDMIWSNNLARACQAMMVDSSGNRFLSFTDGTVARLGDDGTASLSFSLVGRSPTGPSFLLTGPPGKVWLIQTSSNLTTWALYGVVTNNSGGLQFNDPAGGQARARFYRAVPLP
jgi:hypothetical protein